jgi:hypothetical protein
MPIINPLALMGRKILSVAPLATERLEGQQELHSSIRDWLFAPDTI